MKTKPESIPASVYFRYLLLNIPGFFAFVLLLIVVQKWLAISDWVFWFLTACWGIKEIVLFPFVWRSYDPNRISMTGNMIGKFGIVKKRLNPYGYIKVDNELWRAEPFLAGVTIEEGTKVLVNKRKGLTLYVEEVS
ncbi:MAG: NfeD family protein [Desulfobacterales bacterium]